MSKKPNNDEIKIDETAENTAVSTGVTEEGTTEGTTEETEEATEGTEEIKDVPKHLVAIYPILYHSHQYSIGDTLPANNSDMVEAWIAAGTAVWIEDDTNNTKAKAQPRTAEPGQPGVAVSSGATDGEDLVGKVPKTANRKKK